MLYKNTVMIFAVIAIVLLSVPASNGPLLLDSTKLYELESSIKSEGESLYSYVLNQGLGRSLSYASFSLNIAFSDGVSSVAMKWTNIFIHLLIAFLIYLLCKKLFKLFFIKYSPEHCALNLVESRAILCALCVSGLWLFAPINLSTAFYTVQRIAQLATLFVVLGLLFYVYARDAKNQYYSVLLLISAFICVPLALLSKGNGIVLLPLIVLVEMFVWKFRGLYFSYRFYVYSIFISAFLILLLVFNHNSGFLDYSQQTYSLVERLLTQSRILISYLINIILPYTSDTGLFNDDYIVSTNFLSPSSTLPSIFFHLAMISSSIYLFLRGKFWGFGILFFYIAHLVESTVIPLEMYYLHRNYLPSIGVFIAIVLSAEMYFLRRNKNIIIFIVFIYLLFFIAMDYAKSIVWSEYNNVYVSAFLTHPNSPRAISNYAQLLVASGYYSEGLKLLDKSLKIAPKHGLRTRIQKLYVLCQMNAPINVSYYESIASSEVPFGQGIEASQALSNVINLVENKQCNYLDIQLLINALDSIRYSYQEQEKDPWDIDYYIITLLHISNKKTLAYKKAETLFLQGELKAGFYLYDLLIEGGKINKADEIKKLLPDEL